MLKWTVRANVEGQHAADAAQLGTLERVKNRKVETAGDGAQIDAPVTRD